MNAHEIPDCCPAPFPAGVEVRGTYDGVLFYECRSCGSLTHRWPDGTWQHTAAQRIMDRRIMDAHNATIFREENP